KCGIGFLFAPLMHSAMKYAIGPRREIGARTVFNILGPLCNPAGTQNQVIGVYDDSLTEPLANVLAKLGSRHVMVVHGHDGLDEITLTDTTRISELKDGKVKTYTLDPRDLGFSLCKPEDLKGGEAPENAEITLRILKGEDKGPKRDTAVINAAAAIITGGKVGDMKAGIKAAQESIDGGEALKRLEDLKTICAS
ncbi:MAG: anthranilate phosphoribosyltransferase, partial [Nitrospinota bacterium]